MYKTIFILSVLFSLAIATPSPASEPNLKFETYKEKSGDYRWRLKSGSGMVLAQSGQSYKSIADAKQGVELFKKSTAENKLKFDIFMDESKEHRWLVKAVGGQLMVVSGEGHKTVADAEANIQTVKTGLAGAEFLALVQRR